MRNPKGPIVHVLPRLSYGGAELLISELAIRLSEQGHSVELWVFYRSAVIPDVSDGERIAEQTMCARLIDAGVTVQFLNKVPGKRYVETWQQIRTLYQKSQPSVVHLHLEEISFHATMGLLGTGATMVQTVHNTLVRRPRLYRTLFKRYHQRMIAISRDVESALHQLGIIAPQTIYIPNGIETARFAIDRDAERLPRTIIAVGRLSAQKNPQMLIRAYAKLHHRWLKDGRELQDLPILRIIGEGELRPELHALIHDLGLTQQVTLEGLCDDVATALKQADIYAMASDFEGISLALMEAMAARLPIAVTRMTGAKELIRDGETGTVVSIGRADEMADALYHLATDSALRVRYARNLMDDIPPLDTRHMVDRYRDVYETLGYNGQHR